MSKIRPNLLLLIAVLPFLSGAAALSHELLWTRRLIDLLGATDWVVGRVLGLFFLGISLGGYFATLQTRGETPTIKRLILAEALIGLLALPAAFLPFWTDWIWAALGTEGLVSWKGSLIKLFLAMIVIMPSSIAMGFTLPLFIRSVTDQGTKVASVGIWIYALNTLGGVFGLWITSTFLVGWLGAQATMIAISSLNGLVALALWAQHRFGPADADQMPVENRQMRKARKRRLREELKASPSEPGEATFPRWQLVGLSFASGFAVLSLEVLLFRLMALVVPSSYHTTSALLANVILILAASSILISLLNSFGWTREFGRSKWVLAIGLLGAAVCICFGPSILFDQTDKLINIRYLEALNGRTIDSVGDFWALVFGLVVACGGGALFFSGLVFPSLMTASSDDDPAGKKIGILLAVNGIGGLIGTELFNSFLIERVGVYQGFTLLGVILLVIASIVMLGINRWLSLVSAAAVSIFVYNGYQSNENLPYLSPRETRGYKVKAEHFGRGGVSLYVEKDGESKSILVNNQYLLGGSGATLNQRRQLLLPWVLHPEAKSVCCLGLATGISASGLEGLEAPPPVTAVELSDDVFNLAQMYFKDETNGFFDRPENKVVVEDARTYMAAASNEFDLIVGDLYRPHGIGEGRLFSKEHFANVRRALTETGIYCQWLPIYQLNDENWLTIAATFQQVFPETMVLYANLDARHPVLGLMARKNDQPWTAEQLDGQIKAISEQTLKLDPLLKATRSLIVGRLKEGALTKQATNTLDNLEIEIAAGDFWILKDLRKNRPINDSNEFLFGKQLVPFNQRLTDLTERIMPPEDFERFKRTIKAQLQGATQKKKR